MCELLGLCFNKSVETSFSFKGFIRRGDLNPDGWGLAFYPQGGFAVQVIKEPIRAGLSQLADFLQSYRDVSSSIYISHVRYASANSKVSYANTHPFVRELRGREYTFAHNGSLGNNYKSELTTGRWTPVGTTDSEFAFCHIMNVIENKINNWNDHSFEVLQETMQLINKYGKFNCLLSDGEYLFCYRDINGHKGLCYTQREAPYTKIKLSDDDLEVNLSETKMADEKGYVIATRKLTNEKWNDFEPGRLSVFSKGEVIYPKASQDQIILALNCIRKSPNRVTVFDICNFSGINSDCIRNLIDELKDLGYIKQDSRDSVDKYSPHATYYTDPNKRAEIDLLLEIDSNNNMGSAPDFNNQSFDKDTQTLVCMNCMLIYKDGTKFCRKCYHDLIEIDTRILDIIFMLNKKGYRTKFCCSGHADKSSNAYIIIEKKIENNLPLDGFSIKTHNNETIIEAIPYYKSKGITRKKMESSVSRDEIDKYIMNNLKVLREWVELLPLSRKANKLKLEWV